MIVSALMSRKFLIGAALVIIYLALAMNAATDLGLTWDETRHLSGSKARVYSAYAAVTGEPQLEMCDLDDPPMDVDTKDRCWSNRPRLSQTTSGLTWAISYAMSGGTLGFWESIAAHRLSTIIFAAVCIFFVFLFGADLAGTRAGIFSALGLMFMPRFFTHSMYAALDAAVACMVFISVYFFWKGLKDKWWGLFGGIVFGLAISAKVNAYFVVLIVGLWVLLCYRERVIGFFRELLKGKLGWREVPVPVWSFLFVAPVVFFFSWPWLWKDTINRYIALLATRETILSNFYYMGQVWEVPTRIAVWHYVWVMTAVTLPLTILALSLVGGYLALKGRKGAKLVLIGALLPLVFFTFPISSVHDGTRIFLNVFPFIAVLAGLGAARFQESLVRHVRSVHVSVVLVGLIIALPFLMAYSQGPSNLATFYNTGIGGAPGAYEAGFEMDFWGESYLGIAKWLNRNSEIGSKVHVPEATNLFEMYKHGDIGLIGERLGEGRHNLSESFGSDGVFEQNGFLREDITLTELDKADYVVVIGRRAMTEATYPNGTMMFPVLRQYLDNCEPVYTENINGAPLSYIFDARC